MYKPQKQQDFYNFPNNIIPSTTHPKLTAIRDTTPVQIIKLSKMLHKSIDTLSSNTSYQVSEYVTTSLNAFLHN